MVEPLKIDAVLAALTRSRWAELRKQFNKAFMTYGPGPEWERYKTNNSSLYEEELLLSRHLRLEPCSGPLEVTRRQYPLSLSLLGVGSALRGRALTVEQLAVMLHAESVNNREWLESKLGTLSVHQLSLAASAEVGDGEDFVATVHGGDSVLEMMERVLATAPAEEEVA